MQTNLEVAHAWAHGKKSNGLNMSSENGVLYSYSTPIAVKVGGAFIMDISSYSITTSKHQHYAGMAAFGNTFYFEFPCLKNLWGENTPKRILGVIIENYEEFLSPRIEKLRESFSLSDENNIDTYRSAWQQIEELCRLVCGVNVKELIPAYCPIAKYMATHKHATKSQVISFVIGKSAYNEYVGRTHRARKARRTRGLEVEIPEISGAAKERARKALKTHLEEIREENARKREQKRKQKREREEEEERIEKDRQLRIRYTEDELKEKWYKGEFNGHFFSQDPEFFGGGNVLLRMKSGRIETSKGIFLTLNESRKLWGIIKGLHGSEHESLNIEVCTLCGRFTITSFKNDIMKAGCHCIAFSEMERVASLLFEEQEQKGKELIAAI